MLPPLLCTGWYDVYAKGRLNLSPAQAKPGPKEGTWMDESRYFTGQILVVNHSLLVPWVASHGSLE